MHYKELIILSVMEFQVGRYMWNKRRITLNENIEIILKINFNKDVCKVLLGESFINEK